MHVMCQSANVIRRNPLLTQVCRQAERTRTPNVLINRGSSVAINNSACTVSAGERVGVGALQCLRVALLPVLGMDPSLWHQKIKVNTCLPAEANIYSCARRLFVLHYVKSAIIFRPTHTSQSFSLVFILFSCFYCALCSLHMLL